jgi:3-oxoacid CoA-transferase B subunit
MGIWVHSENGILGMGLRCQRGTEDRNLIDAGGNYVTLVPGASFFDSSLSFALVRGGRLDVAFLGALEISQTGDLANWIIPGKHAPGIGGGMELAQKAKRVIVTTTHTTRNSRPKILDQCTLPLTAKGCVDLIITEQAVIEVTADGLRLKEIASDATVEQVAANTAAELIIPDGELPRF